MNDGRQGRLGSTRRLTMNNIDIRDKWKMIEKINNNNSWISVGLNLSKPLETQDCYNNRLGEEREQRPRQCQLSYSSWHFYHSSDPKR